MSRNSFIFLDQDIEQDKKFEKSDGSRQGYLERKTIKFKKYRNVNSGSSLKQIQQSRIMSRLFFFKKKTSLLLHE